MAMTRKPGNNCGVSSQGQKRRPCSCTLLNRWVRRPKHNLVTELLQTVTCHKSFDLFLAVRMRSPCPVCPCQAARWRTPARSSGACRASV